MPTQNWSLNLQILTSGGFRSAAPHSTTKFGGMCFFPMHPQHYLCSTTPVTVRAGPSMSTPSIRWNVEMPCRHVRIQCNRFLC